MVWNEWYSQISTQKREVETSKNNSAFEIDQRGHRGKQTVSNSDCFKQ